jgi:hypothetical protein
MLDELQRAESSRRELRFGPIIISFAGMQGQHLEGLDAVSLGKQGPEERPRWLFRPGREVRERFSLDVSFSPRLDPPWTTNPMWLDYDRATKSYRSPHAFWETEVFEGLGSRSGRATMAMGPHPREEGAFGWRISLREATSGLLSAVAPCANALVLHGCGLVHPEDGRARIFLGQSGAGKSTMNRRLADWELLGDDKVLVWLDGDELIACGTPFMSKNLFRGWGEPHPVESFYALQPGAMELKLEELPPAEAFRTLLQCTFLPYGEGPLVERALEIAQKFLERVTWTRLASNLEHDLSDCFEAVSP